MSTPTDDFETDANDPTRLDRWRRRLESSLERLRARAGMIPDSRLRDAATLRAAERLRRHKWPDALLGVLERLDGVPLDPEPEVASLARSASNAPGPRHHKSYIVGGSIRDVLLGRAGDPTVDIATPVRPERVMALFAHVEPIGLAHGTVLVLEPGGRFECTTFRREGAYADARHPDTVEFTDDPIADLARRDFTVNALAFDPRSGELKDPAGGAWDLERGVLRAVGDPHARFEEDALRPLRAARLAATLELDIDPATAAAMATVPERARLVALERVRDEWNKMMEAPAPSAGIEWLRRGGLLELWLPELAACAGVRQNRYHAYDVYEHSLRCCDAAPAGSRRVRWAALLHDIGKPGTRVMRNGDATFYGHEQLGAELADAALRRLRFPNDEREAIVHLVREHMFDFRAEWSDAALRRWLRRVGVDAVAGLFDLRIADTVGNGLRTGFPPMLDDMRRRIGALLAAEHALTVRDLAIDGDDVMRTLGIGPGPRVGRELEALLERVLDDPTWNRRERLLEALTRGDSRHANAGEQSAGEP